MKNRLSFLIFIFILSGLLLYSGCKSSKKLTETTTPEEKTDQKKDSITVKEPEKKEDVKEKEADPMEIKLNNYFNQIATATSVTSANTLISETLGLFVGPEAPVFIAFYRESGVKDYDKPTNIINYLNYLKDQKKNAYQVDIIIYNSNGKIEEIELITR